MSVVAQAMRVMARWRWPLLALICVLLYALAVVSLDLKPVWLWTDALVYLLIAAIGAFLIAAARRAHLKEPLMRIARDRMAMTSLVVLSAFVVIGVLDSVHFRLPVRAAEGGAAVRYAPEATSLLDILAGDLRTQTEKTYSAPLSLWQYEKESVDLPDGRRERVFPRLKYAGSGVASDEESRQRVWRHATGGAMLGLSTACFIALIVAFFVAQRRRIAVSQVVKEVLRCQGELPWRAIWSTLFILFVVIGAVAALATEYHVLGTDKVGRDVLYKSLKSVRTGLVIGTLTTLVMLPFAVSLGILAGYLRGWVDDVIQYLYTTLSSIPSVLLIAAAVLMLQTYIHMHPELFPTEAERADLRLLFLCIILGVTNWTGLCRLVRGEAMKLREADFLTAARSFGASPVTSMIKHILPNVMHIVLISVVLDFSGLVLAEAVLSYVGVGVDPTTYSWGNMINAARLEMAREPMVWWSLLSAFVFMFVLVLAANLFADVVRDAFDPRLRKR